MSERMRTDWIVPILEDLQNFATEQDMPELAEDLKKLLARHGPQLKASGPNDTDVITMIDPKESGTTNGG